MDPVTIQGYARMRTLFLILRLLNTDPFTEHRTMHSTGFSHVRNLSDEQSNLCAESFQRAKILRTRLADCESYYLAFF